MATNVPDKSDAPGFGLTIWHSDIHAREAYALGAVRFDTDYITQRTLPTVITDGVPADKVTACSFIGTVLCSPAGTVVSGDWSKSDVFQRQLKARRMELDWVYATNLSSGRDFVESTVAAIPKGTEVFALQNFLANAGAISWYTYEGTTRSLERYLGPSQLRRFARLIEMLLTRNWESQRQLAASALDARLRTLAVTRENTFDLSSRFLMEVYDADGCSIFAFVEAEPMNYLECVTSSGLKKDSTEIVHSGVRYNIPNDEKETSLYYTVDVFRGKAKEYRINRRSKWVRESPPVQRRLEAFTLSTT